MVLLARKVSLTVETQWIKYVIEHFSIIINGLNIYTLRFPNLFMFNFVEGNAFPLKMY